VRNVWKIQGIPRVLESGHLAYSITLCVCYQGLSQKFVSEGDKTGGVEGWGQKSPSGVQGQSPDGGLGAKPQKLKIYMLKTIAIMC